MVKVTSAQLQKLAPNARSSFRQAFAEADAVFAHYEINKNGLRLAHFMAQVLHESGGLTIQQENMNYSAKRMTQVWKKRFPTIASAEPFAHNPEKLANKVYGGRMGNVKAGDGFKFIGRGMMQITGRESYERFGKKLGIDLANHPELAVDPQWVLKIACEEWIFVKCNAFADADDLNKITRAINGGTVGIESRRDWLTKTKNVWVK